MPKKHSLGDISKQFIKSSDGIDVFKIFKTIDFDTEKLVDDEEVVKSFSFIAKFLNSTVEDKQKVVEDVDIFILKHYLTHFENKIPPNACNSFFKPLEQQATTCKARDILYLLNLDTDI
ncbi:hypothetical protein BMR1_03g03620 [Babesia microti strain RI]|uniref:Uncharacterized protein n=1 Tax=Babesia microti (strain RI) TaxID=1133968 RepID=A0A0K3ANM6_BABMR|nr:hypothetical protein BMR1_03g03620 [Babesia microti strain RI]CTQ41324.1 hypothetical protein BMR1_03g03620 [Babesia microti strain RI]|eukprot:XP_012649335.1 hypothetical protein BMR1_03g03620 [Babesia microti strain RI]